MHRYLADDEEIVHLTRRHPIVLAKTFLIWLVAILVAYLLGVVAGDRQPGPLLNTVTGSTVALLTAYVGFRTLQWWKARYVVTDQRVLFIRGIIAVKVSAIPFSKVTDTNYSRSVLGRLLGYGSLQLDSAGEQAGFSTLTYLPKADRAYRLIATLLSPPPPARESPARRGYRDPDADDTGPLPRVIL